MGQLKKTYLFSDEKQINPDMIEETVDMNKELDDRVKIGFKTMNIMVNPVVGS